MEHLSLEIFDVGGGGSKYASLPKDTVFTITETSEIFASGDVWSHEFKLNIPANAHIFGTAGEMHGSRLHDQIDKRRARLWLEGLPLYLGYLRLADEVDVDEDGNVSVSFESGMKTFDELIEGAKAREVSVGDVPIGVAMNRKREAYFPAPDFSFTINGLSAYAAKEQWLEGVDGVTFSYMFLGNITTPYVQRWPKTVKSHGTVCSIKNGQWVEETVDYTNVQMPYDAAHPFCNINICYPFKSNKNGEEVAGRGYTVRLGRGKPTTDGGDGETRYNNAPNFYLLYFIDRLFKDLGIHIEENQALGVEDLRRVFLLNYGCHYEEIEDTYSDYPLHTTPEDKLSRYGQFYIPLVDSDGKRYLVHEWKDAGRTLSVDESIPGKVLLRNVTVEKDDYDGEPLHVSAVEGQVLENNGSLTFGFWDRINYTQDEYDHNAYSAYTAYATSDNYPDVDIKDIVDAMKSMFGVRFLFNNDFSTVRIILLRNVFRNPTIQDIVCDINTETKVEYSKRGFRLTYGKGTDDTQFYYKGFNDMFPRAATTWKDTSDRHDYSQWDLTADYGDVKQCASSMNRTCYVTPINGNAYVTKVDEEEDVLFPSVMEVGAFMDAEEGDCSGDSETIEEIQINATPVIMNDVGGGMFASLFTGEMKAPSPDDPQYAQKIATFGRVSIGRNIDFHQRGATDYDQPHFTVSGILDVYLSEGFQIRMMDNYAISNGGTPFDEADAGLQFGIMRGSGSDAHVRYYDDVDDLEENDTWDVEPGSGAIDHYDTCDGYGNEWDYNGSMRISSAAEAEQELRNRHPDTVDSLLAPRYAVTRGEVGEAGWRVYGDMDELVPYYFAVITFWNDDGEQIDVYCTPIVWYRTRSYEEHPVMTYNALYDYVRSLWAEWGIACTQHDTEKLIYAINPTDWSTVVFLRGICLGYTESPDFDNGLGETNGRFSLKLRAEKPNPFFDSKQAESDSNRRYLTIDRPSLRQRGIHDQFYKEYAYWCTHARVDKLKVHMELSQLLSIDNTVKVRCGDITGLLRKKQYQVSNETGLGDVELEIMYL